MANIVFKQLKQEDFKTAPSWMSQIFYIINQFGTSVLQAFNKSISFRQNIDCQLFTYTFDQSASFTPIEIQTTLKRRADGVILLSTYNNTTRAANNSTCSWIPINGGVSIEDISNLSAGNQYVVTFLIM